MCTIIRHISPMLLQQTKKTTRTSVVLSMQKNNFSYKTKYDFCFFEFTVTVSNAVASLYREEANPLDSSSSSDTGAISPVEGQERSLTLENQSSTER